MVLWLPVRVCGGLNRLCLHGLAPSLRKELCGGMEIHSQKYAKLLLYKVMVGVQSKTQQG